MEERTSSVYVFGREELLLLDALLSFVQADKNTKVEIIKRRDEFLILEDLKGC